MPYPASIVGGGFQLKAGRYEAKYGRGTRNVAFQGVDYAPAHQGLVTTAFVRLADTQRNASTETQAEVFVLQAQLAPKMGCEIKLLTVVQDKAITAGKMTFEKQECRDVQLKRPEVKKKQDFDGSHTVVRSADIRAAKPPQVSAVLPEKALMDYGAWFNDKMSLEWSALVARQPKLQPALDKLAAGFGVLTYEASAEVRVVKLADGRVLLLSDLRGEMGNWPVVAHDPSTLKIAFLYMYGGDQYHLYGAPDATVRALLLDFARTRFRLE